MFNITLCRNRKLILNFQYDSIDQYFHVQNCISVRTVIKGWILNSNLKRKCTVAMTDATPPFGDVASAITRRHMYVYATKRNIPPSKQHLCHFRFRNYLYNRPILIHIHDHGVTYHMTLPNIRKLNFNYRWLCDVLFNVPCTRLPCQS